MLLLAFRVFTSKNIYAKILAHRGHMVVINKLLKSSNITYYNFLKILAAEQKIIFSLRSKIIKSRDIFYKKYPNKN